MGVFCTSGTGAFLLYPSPFAGSNQTTAATWRVQDKDAVAADFREAGVEFDTFEAPGAEWADSVADLGGGVRNIWFRDTEGSILSILTSPSRTRHCVEARKGR